jgi:uncharacterized protein YciI
MRTSRLFCLCAFVGLLSACVWPVTAAEPTPGKPNQYIYVLRLVPRLYQGENWTKEDNAILERDLMRFKHAIETGELILAGRTRGPGEKTFGIAIFQAPDETAARKFMESDPAVVAGLMTAALHPFAVAVERKNP